MKLFIASDIHGSLPWCERMLAAFEKCGADKLVLLGDILYHGPRNDLPDGYDPKGVIARLNGYRDRILAVRGNCEAEVDQAVLDFPVLAEYAVVLLGNRTVFLTHGHHHNPDNLPPLAEGDWLISGHTHIPLDEYRCGVRCLNPGSVSLPKGGSHHACLLLTEDALTPIRLDEVDG